MFYISFGKSTPYDLPGRVAHEFILAELNAAARRLPLGKVSGPGGVPNEVSLVVQAICFNLLVTFNRALTASTFPEAWKVTRLVFLHKDSGKPVDNPSNFRSMCMLDTADKLLERLLLARLTSPIEKWVGCHHDISGLGLAKAWQTP